MTPYLQDPDVTLYHGDVLEVLRELPDESVDCAATSPPFYGLRDYGVDGQIGLESTPEEWRDRLVEVFREVRRVLVPSGTLWIECGDSYYAAGWESRRRSEIGAGSLDPAERKSHTGILPGLKAKDMVGAPFLLAFGLRDDGWWWRSTNIWHKPNCLPESVTDRPVVSHSYVFQFSKKARYYHDAEAVREPAEWDFWGSQKKRKTDDPMSKSANWDMAANGREALRDSGRSLRSVWQIPTQPYAAAHFATWPEALASRILLMACPESVCRVCGKARERVVETTPVSNRHPHGPPPAPILPTSNLQSGRFGQRFGYGVASETLGFTDCACAVFGPDTEDGDLGELLPEAQKYRPGIVLDPFCGSGTTNWVARKLGRRSVGIDLNSDYLDLAARRLQQQSLFA